MIAAPFEERSPVWTAFHVQHTATSMEWSAVRCHCTAHVNAFLEWNGGGDRWIMTDVHECPGTDPRSLEYLDDLRRMLEAGELIAIPAGAHYCAKRNIAHPKWLRDATAWMLHRAITKGLPKKRGQSSGMIKRYRQDRIDVMRWDAFNELREGRARLRDEYLSLQNKPGDDAKKLSQDLRTVATYAGGNNEAAFKRAADWLLGTPGFGSGEAIKRSFFKVEKARRDPKQSLRYVQLKPDFLRTIGIDF